MGTLMQEKKKCKHFTGALQEMCKAGVNYRTLVSGPDAGWLARLPCVTTKLSHDQVACLSYAELTAEERTAEERIAALARDRLKLALAAVRPLRTRYKGQDANGTIPCPICAGNLHWRISAYNGHIWGRCETLDCVSWME